MLAENRQRKRNVAREGLSCSGVAMANQRWRKKRCFFVAVRMTKELQGGRQIEITQTYWISFFLFYFFSLMLIENYFFWLLHCCGNGFDCGWLKEGVIRHIA